MHIMEIEYLEKIGLSTNEAKIYFALLEIGFSTVDKISKKSGIHRRTIYDNIEKMLNKGLICSKIIDSKKYFNAAEPHKLEELLIEKKEELKKQEKILTKIMPTLSIFKNVSANDRDVNIYFGLGGIKTILWDILKTGMPNCVLGAHSRKEFKEMLKKFHNERIKLRIPDRMIFKKYDFRRAKRIAMRPFSEVRLMTADDNNSVAINIYNNKVGILNRSPKNPFGILIKNKNIHNAFKIYFEALWNNYEKID